MPYADTRALGNFIGDPNDPASNQFQADVVPNGISGWSPWTSPAVQPAGEAFNVPGNRWTDLATQYGNAGYEPADVANTITRPAQVVAAGIDKVAASYDVPKATINKLKRDGEDAIERRIKLVRDGLGDAEADAATLVPWLNQANSIAAEHRHKQSSSDTHLRPLKMPDGGWGSFNPSTGEVTPLIDGIEKTPPMYQVGLNAAIKAWADAASGVYGDPNSASAQTIITNSFKTIQSIKKKIAEGGNQVTTAGGVSGTATNSLPKILSIRQRQ